jgi:hypothetical protein
MEPDLSTFSKRLRVGECFEFKAIKPLEKIFNAKFISKCYNKDYDLLFQTYNKKIRVEIKRDYKYTETGNIFIQCATAHTNMSGILTTTADYYVFFLSDTDFSLIETKELKKAIHELNPDIKTGNCHDGYILNYETLKNNYTLREFNLNDF